MHYQWYCKFNNWISREAFENSISEFFIHSHKITSYQLSTPIINWQQANCTCTCSMHIFKRIFLSLWLNLAKCSLASRILVHTVHVARLENTLCFYPCFVNPVKRNFVGGWNRSKECIVVKTFIDGWDWLTELRESSLIFSLQVATNFRDIREEAW